MRQQSDPSIDDLADDSADLLESAIDLFTLLSFSLIVSIAAVGAGRYPSKTTNAASLAFAPLSTSSFIQPIPRNVVAILVTGTATDIRVSLANGQTGSRELVWEGA